MSIIAILTAGGTGTRTHQDLPKQFITVENKPIIIYTSKTILYYRQGKECCQKYVGVKQRQITYHRKIRLKVRVVRLIYSIRKRWVQG